MKVDQALMKLKHVLSTERYEHTLRVLQVAEKLAKQHNINVGYVQLAAVFHDYAKEFSHERLKQYIIEKNIDEQLLLFNDELWHGPVAAHLIEHEFGIKNKSVLNAIYYHTTGRANMDLVELALFVADYIEPGRHFPGLCEVREMAFINLHEAALLTLKNTITYLIKRNATIFPHTFQAYNDLILFVTGGHK